MKKTLLFLACASAMIVSAQEARINYDAKAVLSTSKVEVAKGAVLSATKKVNAPQKSAADGVYYKTPAGSLWAFAERPLYSYNNPYNIVAPWTDFTYVNMGTTKKGTWGIKTASTFIDLTEDTDEANNLVQSYSGGAGAYYSPQYTEGDVTYIPATDDGKTMLTCIDAVGLYSFHPSNVGEPKYYGGGSLSTENLYGAGTITNTQTGDVYTSLGIDMSYPRPMSPLYVEKISVWGMLGDVTKDVLSGKTLTMRIYNLENQDAEPVELTCTPDECVLDREGFYIVNFTKKTFDEISGEMVADPFVIDYPAEVIITGFEQDGVNLGLMGYEVNEEFKSDNEDEYTTYLVLANQADPEDIKFLSYKDCVVALGFQSMFDICSVETKIEATDHNSYDADGIRVSNDGQEYGNAVFKDVKGVYVYTALNWTDEETEEELYWSDDMYDEENSWIQNLVVSPILGSDNRERGYYTVGVVCDPLPAGVDKRYAVIHLEGRGVTSEPIFVLQGDITLEEAKAEYAATSIDKVSTGAVKTDNKTYNLAGQQVNGNFKGIVISNGKKIIKK